MTSGPHFRNRDAVEVNTTCVVSLVMTEMPLLVTSDPPSSYSLVTHPQQKAPLAAEVVVEGRMQTADRPDLHQGDSGS